MSDPIDRHEHERALADVRRRWLITTASVLGVLAVLFFSALGVGWTLVDRAQEAAPEVIEEIATERRAALETRLLMRSQEAQALAADLFVFLQRVWQENAALHRVRANVQGATTELRLLTSEVNAAMVSPTQNLGTLLENGPTRARAVLDGRDYVIPDDVKALAHPVLRHRILTNFHAESERVTTDQIIDQLLAAVPVPRSGM